MNYQCGHSIGRHHETAADGYPICPKCLHVERDKLRAENANLKSKRHITLTQAREQALFNIERSRERAKWADTQAENAELKEEQAQWDMAHPYNLRCRGKTKDEFNERLLSLLPSDFPLKAENAELKNLIKQALRIQDLWFSQSDEPEHQEESYALAAMLHHFEDALKE